MQRWLFHSAVIQLLCLRRALIQRNDERLVKSNQNLFRPAAAPPPPLLLRWVLSCTLFYMHTKYTIIIYYLCELFVLDDYKFGVLLLKPKFYRKNANNSFDKVIARATCWSAHFSRTPVLFEYMYVIIIIRMSHFTRNKLFIVHACIFLIFCMFGIIFFEICAQ